MKEKYVKPVANSEGKGKSFFPVAEAFVEGAAIGRAVRNAFGVKEYVERYATLETSKNRVFVV